MPRPRVFVAQPIPEPALDILRQEAEVTVYPYLDRQITVDELAAAAGRADWLYVLHETHVPAEVINANPHLKGIAALAVHDPDIDIAAANARKLPIVTEHPGEGFEGVHVTTADLTVAMLMSLAYRLGEADRFTRSGKFKQEQTMALLGLGCPGKTVGLIGFGKVARHFAPRIRALGMNLIYTKRTRLSREEEQSLGLEWIGELDDLLLRSDYACVLCDYTAETHKLIGRREINLIGPNSYLVNTARGRIVDQAELILALQEKRIAGAALDVFWDEPPHVSEPSVPEELCKLDNVILAPHNGGATWDVRTSRTSSVARGLVQLIRGERPATILNPEIYDTAKIA